MSDTRTKLFILFQYFAPQHLLSRFVGKLAASKVPFVKNNFIQYFVNKFPINMQEAAQEDPLAYESFNAFFTRALKSGVRPIDADEKSIVSPADGEISQLGPIAEDAVFQAKGHYYSLCELLGGDVERAKLFLNGHFATVYLSPKDYHRVHMPMSGILREMIFVPGDLFSVNTKTAENVPRLFARNERVVAIFDTEHGPMALVLVGAMVVASIETVWAGVIAPMQRKLQITSYTNQPNQAPIYLEKGAEMGRFLLGSTAIICLPKDCAEWLPDLQAGSAVRMGGKIGMLK